MPSRTNEKGEGRQRDLLLSAGGAGAGVLLVVLGTFAYGILVGVGGLGYGPGSELARRSGPGASRWAALVPAAILVALGLFRMWLSRYELEAMGFAPAKVRSRIGGLGLVAALLMICAGLGGLASVVSLFTPARPGWDIHLEPVDNARPLVIAFAVYTLAGVFLLVKSWRQWWEEAA